MEATQPASPPSFETVWAALQETDRILKENAERHEREMKENAERHEREMKENAERHEREMKESAERREREMKENAERREREMKENAERREQEMKENAERHERHEREAKERDEQYEKKMKELKQQVEESRQELNRQLGKYINLFGEVTEYTMAPKLCEKFIEFGLNFYKTTRNISVRDKTNKVFFEIDVMLENDDIAMLVEIKTKLTVERINDHVERLEKMRQYSDSRGDKRTFLGAVAGVVVTDKERNYALEQGFYLVEPSGESLNITAPNGKPKEW